MSEDAPSCDGESCMARTQIRNACYVWEIFNAWKKNITEKNFTRYVNCYILLKWCIFVTCMDCRIFAGISTVSQIRADVTAIFATKSNALIV